MCSPGSELPGTHESNDKKQPLVEALATNTNTQTAHITSKTGYQDNTKDKVRQLLILIYRYNVRVMSKSLYPLLLDFVLFRPNRKLSGQVSNRYSPE